MAVYTDKYIIEYDGLANANQITLYDIHNKKQKGFSFAPEQPLTKQLQFFINSFNQSDGNFLDYSFMKKLFFLWREIKK